MPHQLRRVITINIRNPNGGLPSGRIAEMDPRGGVLAVGDNGVGKTTFLRLLPLFYGATPTQILRGTGRSVLISYTLPDASSAVCFEYERESETDLRCVVVHAHASEEAPVFHIIRGGYREDFFYDENNQYVIREEFKPRVESMGYEVSRRLALHEYRAVILNERLPTKQGTEFRRLAALHSLGPSPLYNLDQIAAAMANEKINFRDLQNIVLERVSDSAVKDNRTHSIKELKQNRDSVTHWLDARAHLAAIMKRKDDAQHLKDGVVGIKKTHFELCTLHVAVKKAMDVSNSELNDLTGRQEQSISKFNEVDGQFQSQINTLSPQVTELESMQRKQAQACKSAQARLEYFAKINVDQMKALQEQEGELKQIKVSKETEKSQLESTAGDAASRAGTRKQSIESIYQTQYKDINDRLDAEWDEQVARTRELASTREHALENIEKPVRLTEIEEEQIRVAGRLGELKSLIAKPVATEQSEKARDVALEEASNLQDNLNDANNHEREVQAHADEAKSKWEESTQKVTLLEKAKDDLVAEIEELQATLTPAPGSLLEFIRGGDMQMWSTAAKVLDRALLERTDLHPEMIESFLDSGQKSAQEVQVGPVLLHVEPVSTPDWVDMSAIRLAIEKVTAQLKAVMVDIEGATTAVKKLYGDHQKKAAALVQASARSLVAKDAFEVAKANYQRLKSVVEIETVECKAGSQKEREALLEKQEDLVQEKFDIEVQQADRIKQIKAEFDRQAQRLNADGVRTENRFKEEFENLLIRKDKDIEQIDFDLARELEGLGIDPIRLGKLAEEISAADGKLSSIASNRHEVNAWSIFCRDVLPTMELEAQKLIDLEKDLGALQLRLSGLITAKEQLLQDFKHTQTDLQSSIDTRRADIKSLEGYKDILKDFLDFVPPKLVVEWTVVNLGQRIATQKSQLISQMDAVQKEYRSIRNEIIKVVGGPSDWLDLKEKELPDRQILLEHQYLCEQAQVVCDWFESSESGPYIDQLCKEMLAFFNLAGAFVGSLEQFERRVDLFNTELQKALKSTEKFERFKDLSVTVSSSVGQLSYLKVLRQMQEKANSNPLSYRTIVRSERDLPSDEDAALVRTFRDLLEVDGGFKVNLNEQVRLKCTLIENGSTRVIASEEEFRSVSSNGNTALITAMFLMGFIQMIRGDAPVRLTWVTDEIGRFDPGNLGAFLKTLDNHKIDVISACPSIDPALAVNFPRLCIFESNGSVSTSHAYNKGADHVAA